MLFSVIVIVMMLKYMYFSTITDLYIRILQFGGKVLEVNRQKKYNMAMGNTTPLLD